jgi:hypothetical protein
MGHPQTASWLSSSWQYRGSVSIANAGGTTLTGYQLNVVLAPGFDFTKAQSNGGDIRFTASDGVTLLPYWIESWNPGNSSASLWVKVPSIPAAGATIYMYFGNPSATSASNGNSTFDFFDDFSLGSVDTTKWTVGGGSWTVVTDTLPNGLTGRVLQGTTNIPTNELLYSTSYTGTDYIWEANGKLLSGREWGLGARLNGPTNLYSSDFYADLDTTNNVYVYKWLNNDGSNWATQLGAAAVGTVNLNTWYKLSMAVHSSSIDVSVNGVPSVHTSDAQFPSGGVAIFGGENMVAHFSYVRSRQYAATVPTITIGTVITNGVSAASLTLNPTVVVGGTSSQGTVTLSGPAPAGGATVTLTSSNTAAAQVPASVVVPAAASSAAFTITTATVSSSTTSTISASYNSTTKTATLGITAATVGWLSSSWQYRGSVSIANAGGTTLTGYQLNVVLSPGFDFTKAQSNGGDIRFTASDGVTELPYWIESWNPGSSSASLWVKVPSIPAAGATIYMYFGNLSATSGSNGNSTFDFFDDFSLGSVDTTKWTVGGGSWTVVTDTLPNGLRGPVLQGTTNIPPNEMLYSASYTGTDYIWEANGKLLSGREWGLGARLNGPTNLYSSDFYADLDTTNNVYVYKWLNNDGSNWATQLGAAAVGTVNLNTWYKLSMAVHSSSIDVSVNGVPSVHTSDAQFPSGGVAIFGGENMVAHFSYVRSRKYAVTLPTATVGVVTTNGVSAASLTLNPKVVVGGASSQGTVTLSGPAPAGGATVTLTSSNTAAAQVPASVVVPAAASSATFTITTSTVSSSTTSTISASFGGTKPTASLTVAQGPPAVASVTLNPATVLGGNTSQGTVKLTGPALSSGATVTLTSSDTALAQVPVSVVVPAAASSATFTITTSSVSSSTTSTISASYNSSTQTATLTITQVASSTAVPTYHNDNLRTGQSVHETILTTANVNSSTFGKLFSLPVDGPIFAQPLYIPGVTVGTQVHNLVFVATEHNSVYAWDADAVSTTPVWHASFINPAGGVTAIPCAEAAGNDCSTITPEFGITSTPVIDSPTGTLYVVASTKEVSGGTTSYVYRLHALSISTGQEKFGGPVVIQAASGSATLVPKQQLQRPGLLLVNGVVYIGFGSHGDTAPWYGWLLGYSASTLQRVMVFNTAPVNGEGAIWQSGCGPAADASGNIYFNTGNGPFDANTGGIDYGDTVVKLSPAGTVLDYFTPYNQATLDATDADVGSSGLVLLPDQSGTYTHVLIGAGKQGVIYSVNRDGMGKYNGTSNQNIQSLAGLSSSGLFGSPAYWNGNVYFAAWNDYLRAFQVTNGTVAQTSHSSITLAFPGATPSVSSNGTSNGIVWIIQENVPNDTVITNPPTAVLRAYDATNLANELYDSTQTAGNRDAAGGAVKFAVPTVANGKVYIGNSNQLTVYGLLP